jgi:predicted DNA-binding protein (MmcQ/YjbR family)
MFVDQLRDFCLHFPHSEEGFPFDQNTLVFSVFGKMFCLVNIEKFEYINLKCNPEKAIELREIYPEVTPGFHMNKKHWNSVRVDGTLSDDLLHEWIRDSYALVVSGLPKKYKDLIHPFGSL